MAVDSGGRDTVLWAFWRVVLVNRKTLVRSGLALVGALALVMLLYVMGQSDDRNVSAGVPPTPTPSGLKSVAVQAGTGHSCELTAIGEVKCWGGNSKNNYQPETVPGLTGIVALEAGHNHNCALTATGGVLCWGNNLSGQLGDGNACGKGCDIPVTPIDLSSGVVAIAVGGEHSCAITTSGGLKCWGRNTSGALGIGSTAFTTVPMDVIGLSSGVVGVGAGGQNTCAVTTSGAVKCWGDNRYGQVGDGTTAIRTAPVNVKGLGSGVTALSNGVFHTCALTTGGGLKCWGLNDTGQLGIGSTSNRSTPADVVGLSSGVAAIGSGGGGQHTCAVTTGGGLKCWGRNHWGQVGDDSITNRLTPVDVVGLDSNVAAVSEGSFHTCALQGGQAKCWGQNQYGQLASIPALGPEECAPMGPCSKTPVDIEKGPLPTPTSTPCPAECQTPTSTPVPPASYVVNSTADVSDIKPGNGSCATSGGVCTLRAAIQEVNANPGPDVVVPGGVYFLSAGQLSIAVDLNLSGAGAESTIVDGSSLGRVFHIAGSATAELSGITIRNGLHTIGGGIRNDGDLTLNSITIAASSVTQRGGGIFNEGGNLTLNDSTVSGNSAGITGGGIHNIGTMTINNSEISGNSGGGITNRYGGSVLTINDSVISGNSAKHAAGISNQLDSIVTVNDTTISSSSTSYALGGAAIGNNAGGVFTINNSAITGNTAGAATSGISNSGEMTVNNSTISGNGARGIENAASGVLSVNNSTVANNASYGIYNSGNAATLKNTIVANNGFGGDCEGPITSAGHNLSSDSSCGLTGLGDLSNTSPGLSPLADNGGPTFTHALLPGSPAIDAGSSDCPPPGTDQRGAARPGDGDGDGTATCDIGAYECPTGGCLTPTATPTPSVTPTPDPTDTDGDGCTDQRENGPDEMQGGMRDPLNPNDYYDVNGDRIIDLPNDILGVIQHYAPTGTEPTYDVTFDRGPQIGANVWNMSAPDGAIDLPNDILGVIRQFNHSCQ